VAVDDSGSGCEDIARIYLGQSGEGCKHGWVSLAGGSRALRLAAEIDRRLGLAESKGNKHGWTAYKLRKFDWLYISLPCAEAQGVHNGPGCSAVGLRHTQERAGGGGWTSSATERLTWSKRRCDAQTEDPRFDDVCILCDRPRCVCRRVGSCANCVYLLSFADGTWRPDRTPPRWSPRFVHGRAGGCVRPRLPCPPPGCVAKDAPPALGQKGRR
jgi:hypothetical protein